MAKRGPKGPHSGQIQPGQILNPSGRSRLPPEIRAIRSINGEELQRLISKYFRMGLTEFELSRKNTELPRIEVYIITMIQSAIDQSDPYLVQELLNRMAGKVKEQVSMTLNKDEDVDKALDGVPQKNVIELLRSGRVA